MGIHYYPGTAIINKIVNLFTLNIPRALYKISRYFYTKITKNQLDPYQDPWWIKGDFSVFKFNYFPFEYFKRKYLIWQINKHFKTITAEDMAF